jgi:hypothetical protein
MGTLATVLSIANALMTYITLTGKEPVATTMMSEDGTYVSVSCAKSTCTARVRYAGNTREEMFGMVCSSSECHLALKSNTEGVNHDNKNHSTY